MSSGRRNPIPTEFGDANSSLIPVCNSMRHAPVATTEASELKIAAVSHHLPELGQSKLIGETGCSRQKFLIDFRSQKKTLNPKTVLGKG